MTVRPLAGAESVTEGIREAAALVDPNAAPPRRGSAATVLSKAKSVQPTMLSGARGGWGWGRGAVAGGLYRRRGAGRRHLWTALRLFSFVSRPCAFFRRAETNLLHRISEASRQVMDRILEEQASCPEGPPPPIDFGHGDVLRLERQVRVAAKAPIPGSGSASRSRTRLFPSPSSGCFGRAPLPPPPPSPRRIARPPRFPPLLSFCAQVLLPELRRMQRNHLRLMTKTVGGAIPDEVAARKLFIEYVREQHRT